MNKMAGFLAHNIAVTLLVANGSVAYGEQESDNDDNSILEEVYVVGTASRLPDNLENFPGSVTVIDQTDLDKIRKVDDDLGVILGKHVPGFGTSGGKTSATNFDHTLRGRKPTVLIDGVPITTPLRDGGQDFRSIHSSVLGGIEVIRGATSLYGNGGAGGVINYTTKQPVQGEVEFVTEIGTSFSATNFSDSASPFFLQGASGKIGDVDFIVNAHYTITNKFFDADGDMIPTDPHEEGGIADTKSQDFFTKIGYNFSGQRIELMANYFSRKQDTDYITQDGDIGTRTKTRAIKGVTDPRAEDQGTENLVVNLAYTNEDIMGSSLRMQAFYQESENIFGFFDSFPDGGGQPFIESEKIGARIDIKTDIESLFDGADILWGLDFLSDETGQTLKDGRLFAPLITQDSVAGFAQMGIQFSDRVTVRGGLRYEQISLDVPDFTTLFSQVDVTGGEIDYSATTGNIGIVFTLTDHFDLFSSYSEGYSVAEVGRLLRQLDEPTNVEDQDLEASIIDSYEVGIRGNWDSWNFSLALFENKSNLGTRVSFVDGQFVIQQDPQKVYGIELMLAGTLSDTIRWNASYTWMEGETTDSEKRPLSGRTIPPRKLSASIEYDVSDTWQARLQLLHSGNRDRFPGSTSFGEARIDSFTTVDLSSSFDLAKGTISVGIDNLFNEDYFPVLSQMQNLDCCISKAPGRMGMIKYTITY